MEDHSGNWQRGLEKHFGAISRQNLSFPDWLGPLYLENTAMVGAPFVMLDSTSSVNNRHHSSIPLHEGYLLVKVTVQLLNQTLSGFLSSFYHIFFNDACVSRSTRRAGHRAQCNS